MKITGRKKKIVIAAFVLILAGAVGLYFYTRPREVTNYAEFEEDGAFFQVWLEDEQSIEEKMKLIEKYDLSGVAEWKLGFERATVWGIISSYLTE